MKYFYTYQEAADELGLSVSTVQGAVYRGSMRVQADPVKKTRKYITRVSLEQYRKKMRVKNKV